MDRNPIVNAGAVLELEVDRLLDPARFWDHPRDVLEDPFLSLSEKKSILASWASDRCAVASNPLLRKPENLKQPILFDDVMDALKQLHALERAAASPRSAGRPRPSDPTNATA